MKTKEAVLKEHVSLYFSSHHDKSQWNGEGEHGGAEWHADKPIAVDIYKAMDEWAQAQALAFLQFAFRNKLQFNNEEEVYNNTPDGYFIYKNEDAYKWFTKEQS